MHPSKNMGNGTLKYFQPYIYSHHVHHQAIMVTCFISRPPVSAGYSQDIHWGRTTRLPVLDTYQYLPNYNYRSCDVSLLNLITLLGKDHALRRLSDLC